MKKVILLIFLTFICTGCYNYKELNELGIVSAMGISKDGDLYNLDIQLLNVLDSEKSGLNKSPITVISGQGETIFEAARSMNKKTSKVFFLADVDYVFLDQSVLNDGLDEIMDFLIRDTRLSLNFLVVAHFLVALAILFMNGKYFFVSKVLIISSPALVIFLRCLPV